MNAIAATGAYCLIMASTLILRAALRYFSDSDRKEVDKCDIPRKAVRTARIEKGSRAMTSPRKKGSFRRGTIMPVHHKQQDAAK